MNRPDEQTIGALHRLKMNADFQKVISWFQDSLQTADKKNRSTDGPALHRGQGEASTLAYILDSVEDTREVLDRFNKK